MSYEHLYVTHIKLGLFAPWLCPNVTLMPSEQPRSLCNSLSEELCVSSEGGHCRALAGCAVGGQCLGGRSLKWGCSEAG